MRRNVSIHCIVMADGAAEYNTSPVEAAAVAAAAKAAGGEDFRRLGESAAVIDRSL